MLYKDTYALQSFAKLRLMSDELLNCLHIFI